MNYGETVRRVLSRLTLRQANYFTTIAGAFTKLTHHFSELWNEPIAVLCLPLLKGALPRLLRHCHCFQALFAFALRGTTRGKLANRLSDVAKPGHSPARWCIARHIPISRRTACRTRGMVAKLSIGQQRSCI